MPHLIIEFTEGLASAEDIDSMLDAMHATLASTGLFNTSHIRIRVCPLHYYRCGGTKVHFIHAQLRLHRGRNAEQKHRMSECVVNTLRNQQWRVHVITVEVVELDRESYAKFMMEWTD